MIHQVRQEEILNERIRCECNVLLPHLNSRARLRRKEIKENVLTEYMTTHKKEPSDKRILHDLINLEYKEEPFLIRETEYSNIKVWLFKCEHRTMVVLDFKEKEGEGSLRLAFLCLFNLPTAMAVNFPAKTKTTIGNLNYLLCEVLELLAMMESETDSSEIDTSS